MTKPRYIAILVVALALFISGCSAARKNYSEGRDLEEQGKLEEAMYRYAEAVKAAPEESEYRVKFLNTRMAAARGREQEGDTLLKTGNYAGAVAAYQTAAGLDPSQPRLVQKANNAIRLRDAAAAYQEGLTLEKGNKLRDAATAFGRALDLAAENPEYRSAAQRIAALRKSKLDGFELQLKSKQPITLRFRETRLKDIFSVISQLSGINFIFDPDVKDQSVTITLENATFRQSTDLLTGMYKLGHKILNETTVLIYPQSAEKTKQYQDMQLRTFHLNHLDAKKAANLIRTMLQVRRLYINEDANALVVRDTSDVTDVIEKILEAHDLPEAEVVLDVEVIEISDKNAHNVGLLLSNYDVQLGAFSPSNELLATTLKDTTSTTSTTVTTDATIKNLVKAFSINSFGGYVTVPNAQYNFGKTLTNGEVLSNPKIRVKNKEKAKFNVGTRVPITTTTMATTGTTSQVNVQYVDVGVKVNAEPTIQLNNEVSIKLGLEVSSIISRETVGGKDSATTVVTIGTRNLDTVLSLKDGETSVIGGLISHSNSDSKQKIFLLGDIPLIGPLLSNSKTDNDKTELILAITPRLVRGVTVQPRKVTSFISGKEDDPSVTPPYASFEQEPEYAAPVPAAAVHQAVPAIKPQPPQGIPAQPSTRPAPLPTVPAKTGAAPQQQPGAAAATPATQNRPVMPPPARKPNSVFKMAPVPGRQQPTTTPVAAPVVAQPAPPPPPVTVEPEPVPAAVAAEPDPAQAPPPPEPDLGSSTAPPEPANEAAGP
ncbi:secretin N-terminal domain-containing protein [Trichlorobacter lovleyi]|uniref:Type II and III secretion system protein n=1 Tax=Trichlorobacter lovleyi (strain ATCC BAA-1151 / DSM 17278 / SZ) TaxID=398767 RepID=B3E8R3_TRIL1|nr:secretin N-terminal domain-containing protein [Trichlorobacter lovleyi]ACD95181.1 type II and III secretion system protein [Trichlorobacter lovleyi SZ]